MRRRLALVVAGLVTLSLVAAATVTATRATKPLADGRYVLLVMGSDMGPWRAESVLDGRSDALHLVVVVPRKRAVSILSFPRDLYVQVPGVGTTRINTGLTRGPERAVETVEQLTGLTVDDWIVTGMKAFQDGVNAFGGVEVDVPQRLQIDGNVLEPGAQHLDGVGALVYGRDRKNRSDGDFGRNRAQGELLALLHAELVARDPSPTQLLSTISELRRHTVSSIPPTRMALLAGLALDIDPADVVRAQVPGANTVRGGAAVVVATSGAERLFADLRDDGRLTP